VNVKKEDVNGCYFDINKAMENVNTKIVIEFAPKGFGKDQYKFEKLKNRINERIEHHKTLINDFKFIKNTECLAYKYSEYILEEYEYLMKGIE